MKPGDTASWAAAVLTAAVTFTAFVASPYLERFADRLELQAAVALLSLPGFYLVFASSHRLLARWQRREILGEWHYSTWVGETAVVRDQNFARMTLFLDDNDMVDYKVDLYPDGEAMAARRNQRGHAYSEAVRYDPKRRRLVVLYRVEYFDQGKDNPARTGRLVLNLNAAGELHGEWVSDLYRERLSHGRMFAARPKAFAKWLEEGRPDGDTAGTDAAPDAARA